MYCSWAVRYAIFIIWPWWPSSMRRSSARCQMRRPCRKHPGGKGLKNNKTAFYFMRLITEFGRYLLMLRGMFSKPENAKMYWKEFMHQCSEIGIGSLGIVVIISIFMGAVSTLQTAYQLVSPLIPLSTIAQIVRDTVILEFSPTLVCIVLAGVVGSKIASELGNMRVSEQIDALEIMGINTRAYLIMPKILA